ncbi:BrnT family toxin [soil metagenome]
MKIWSEPIEFEWDKGNKDKNLEKHRVTNREAEEIFNNQPVVILEDQTHSTKIEKRYQIIGATNKKRVLNIIITIREDKVRIISARDANRKEKEKYEET